MTSKRLIRDANALDPYACLAMGYYLQNGKEFDPDLNMAVVWYQKAASGGCARAHWELAKMYHEGNPVPCDMARYIDHLRRSAKLGNIDAQITLAREYHNGSVIQTDDRESLFWYRKAAENGSSKAKFMVGYYHSKGMGVQTSEKEAELWYSSASMSGDGDLFLEIGTDYEFGLDGIEQDDVEAMRWYSCGSDMGHEKCHISLISISDSVGGRPRDTYVERMEKLSMAKTQKEIDMCSDALAMAEEFFDAGDERRAFSYYERASSLGSPEAMFIISMMYHQGIYVDRNDKRALSILKRAASAGSADAQFFLGRMYDGHGLPKDEAQAINYYTQAAANGFLAAYYYLGRYMSHPEIHVRRSMGR